MRVWTRRLRSLFGGTGRLAALATAFAVAETALLVPIALLLKRVFDDEIPAHDSDGIAVTGVIVLALYLGSAGVAVLNRGVATRTITETVASLRRRLLEQLYLLPRSWHDRHGCARQYRDQSSGARVCFRKWPAGLPLTL